MRDSLLKLEKQEVFYSSTDEGDLYTWGDNEAGQLGHPGQKKKIFGRSKKKEKQSFPRRVQFLCDQNILIKQVACGGQHLLALAGLPILSYPILSYPILSYPILSYPILSYPILSYPFTRDNFSRNRRDIHVGLLLKQVK
jgi:hypothetical protein